LSNAVDPAEFGTLYSSTFLKWSSSSAFDAIPHLLSASPSVGHELAIFRNQRLTQPTMILNTMCLFELCRQEAQLGL
jgi:hypothetical protein